MTDKEVFFNHWLPTLGQEECEKSWELKMQMMARKAPSVMSDIEPYQSQVDGSWITSRSKHREHLKQHRMIEVGNDVSFKHKTIEPVANEKRKQALGRAVYEKLKY